MLGHFRMSVYTNVPKEQLFPWTGSLIFQFCDWSRMYLFLLESCGCDSGKVVNHLLQCQVPTGLVPPRGRP